MSKLNFLLLLKNSNTGFSLIELLIVISIMVALFSFGFANYKDFSRRQEIESALRDMRAELRLAQERAVSGDKPAGCDTLRGYQVRLISNTAFTIEAVCDNATYTQRTVDLYNKYVNIEISAFPDLLFSVLPLAVNTSATITLTHTILGETRQILISTSGQID